MKKYKLSFDYKLNYEDLLISYLKASFDNNLISKLKLENENEPVYVNLVNIYESIEQYIDRDDENYIKLFKNILDVSSEEKLTLADLIIYGRDDKELTHLTSTLSQLWGEDIKDINHLNEYIMSDDSLSYEFKYYVMLITQKNFDFTKLLADYLKIFDNVKNKITVDYNEIVNYVKSYLTDSYVNEILEKYKVNFEVNSEFIVSINLILLNGITLMYHDHLEKGFIKWGVFAHSNQEEKNIESKKESLMDVSKVLSDQTKLSILIYCLKKERFGAEIAKHIKVSGATISHHMSHLTSFGYVSVRVDTKKIYYKTNVDKIIQDSSYVYDLLNV